jgi:hypothetical protein
VGLLGASTASAAYASIQNNGVFEVNDGNAIPATLDDWANVCHEKRNGSFPAPFTNSMACVTASNTSGATAVEWQPDGAALDGSNYNASIFTGGGSKDPQDISSWQWKDNAGGLPDKDNLLHSFAARYTTSDSTPQDVLFFGSDRYDNSGDAVQGFWFFQNKIELKGTGTGTFTGLHKNGDLLVLSDFSNGGSTSIISVLAWDSTCAKGVNSPSVGQCADVNLRLKGTSTSANCGAGGTLTFCGIVNGSNGTPAPWPYKDKSGNSTYLQGEFFEGGLNLTALGFGGTCFASAASETRSSTSTTATLKDFVLGNFGVCGAELVTSPSTTGLEIGGSLTDTAAITVKGSATPPAPTGSVAFYVCGPSAGISNCDSTSGTSIGSVNLSSASQSGNTYSVTSASYTPSTAGDYCFAASWSGDSNYTGGPYADGSSTECFTVTPKQATISTSQDNAPPTGAPLGTTLHDQATIGNTANTPTGTPDNGSIVFSLYGPFSVLANPTCTDPATGVTGNRVYQSGAIAVSGDGTYPASYGSSVAFAPTSVGYYQWVAAYTPGSVNTVGKTSNCGDEPAYLFALQPTADTTQTWRPQDSMTVNVATGAGNLTGNVTFKAFDTLAKCQADAAGTASYTQTVNATSNTGQTLTVATANGTSPNATFDVSTNKSIWWKASFASTNSGIKNVTSNCTETSSVSIENGSQANTP